MNPPSKQMGVKTNRISFVGGNQRGIIAPRNEKREHM